MTFKDGVRAYLVQTAEKGIRWLKLRVRGRAGHGSMVHEDNAVAKLSEAVAKLGNHRFPLVLTDSVREFLDGVSELTGWEFPEDDIDTAITKLGNLSRQLGIGFRSAAHRAEADAEVAAEVLIHIARHLANTYALEHLSPDLLVALNRLAAAKVPAYLGKYAQQATAG